jgi:hypothetical protein
MLKEAMLNTIILSNLQVKILPNPQSKTLKRSEFLPISSKIFHSIITLFLIQTLKNSEIIQIQQVPTTHDPMKP